MGIDGVTNNAKQARLPLLGKLAKGDKTPNGGARDLDYFRFVGFGPFGPRLEEIWREIYGERPVAFPDVRIPSVAGNFDIEKTAWERAYMFMKRDGNSIPVLLAEGDHNWVLRLRDEKDASKINYYEPGQLAQASMTELAATESGAMVPHLRWNGKLYMWRPEMTLDLVFTEFAEAVYADGNVAHGVVRFVTHSVRDIGTLTQEYYAALARIATAFSASLGGYEKALIEANLDTIPFRLWRQSQLTTSPPYQKEMARSRRVTSERSFVHWGLNPQIAAVLAAVIQANTDRMLERMLRGALPGGNPVELGMGLRGQLPMGDSAESVPDVEDEVELGEVWEEDVDDTHPALISDGPDAPQTAQVDPETGEIVDVSDGASSAENPATDAPAPTGGASVGGGGIHPAVPGDQARTLAEFAKWYAANDPLGYYENNYQIVKVLQAEWPDIGVAWAVRLYNGQPSAEIYEVLDAHARQRGPEKAAKSKK